MSTDDDKRLAAEAAVAEIRDGMLVGLGTGTTAAHAIRAIGRRRKADFPNTAFFSTSRATRKAAIGEAIPVGNFAFFSALDLAIDGTDEIDQRLNAIKGAGGAMLREKIIAASARRMIVIADSSKRVTTLGGAALPVEILPFSRSFVTARLVALGATVTLREGARGPYRTDNGNAVLDCHFGTISDSRALALAIDAIPGALGHGLFLDEIDAAYIAAGGVVTRLERATLKS